MKNRFKIGGIILTFFLMSFRLVSDKKVIVIDAGHGGRDIGVYVGNAYEKKIVEDISKQIKALNKKKDIEIVLLRDSDTFTDLNERVQRINKLQPDLVISLHVDQSNDKTANGITAAISEQNQYYQESRLHAQNLTKVLASKNSKAASIKMANLFLLKNANSPAVSVELGFLSNEVDKNYLMSQKGQTKIAKQILKCLNK